MMEGKKRKKRISGLNIADTYKHYTENTPKEKRVKDKAEYYAYVKKFFDFLSDKLLDIGIVKLPYRMGVLQIMGDDLKVFIDRKTGKVKGIVDWPSTMKLWESCDECKKKKQLVFYTNDESGFKIYRVYWFNKSNPIVNKKLYRFKPSRTFSKRIAKKIKSGDYAYLYKQKKIKKYR